MKRFQLSARQRRRLEQRVCATRRVSEYRRLVAVLEVNRGTPLVRIAETLQVSRQSVHNWLERYRAHPSAPSLQDRYEQQGRPSAWGEECDEALQVFLEHSPERWGFSALNWTVPLLQECLEDCLGEHVSDDTVRRRLHVLGYVWKRPRYVLEPDPEAEKKTQNPAHIGAIRAGGRGACDGRDASTALPPFASGMGCAR